MTATEGLLSLGDFPLRKGGVIRDARLGWRTHGTLNAARDNVVLYPTSYGAQTAELTWLVGPDGILDPTKWFIVQPEMFGNGVSSSPSNTADFPALVTSWDNVAAQQRLLAPAQLQAHKGAGAVVVGEHEGRAHLERKGGQRRQLLPQRLCQQSQQRHVHRRRARQAGVVHWFCCCCCCFLVWEA